MKEDDKFCGNCGKKVERATPPPARSTRPAPSPIETAPESVIGGLASADMARPGSLGYGIYITDRRVIGIKKPDQFAKSVGGAIAGAVIGKMLGFDAPWAVSSALGRSLSNDENIHLLAELETNKDFEAINQDITLIQLQSPGLVSLGQLAIFLRGQQTTNIAIALRTERVFENLKEMVQTHYPQVLRII
jgi:hypothetical protein